ncbi:MAG: ferrochelatase [Elusimicrobiota bacterium]
MERALSRSAVLLMAYGAPRELSEIPAYLQDIRGGRPVSAELVREITRRYESIGGRSPLLDITRKQADALEALLEKEGEFGVYIGMRHSEPGIASAVEALLADGHRSVLALPLTPYQSRMSTGAYLERLTQAVAAKGAELDIRAPAPWNEDASLVSAFAGKVREALDRRPKAAVLFTAHSLPESILREGDPYAEQLLATARAVAAEAGVASWRLAYQSRPVSSGSGPAEPWLGPDAGEELTELASAGAKAVVLSPIGFIRDHLETLYDADILYRRQAEGLGLAYERAASLNDDPLLIGALASVVRSGFTCA